MRPAALARSLLGVSPTQTRSGFPPAWLTGQLDAIRYGGAQSLLGQQGSYGPREEPRPAGEAQAVTSNGIVYGVVRGNDAGWATQMENIRLHVEG